MKGSRTAAPLVLLGLLLGLLRLGDGRLTVPLHSLSAFTSWLNATQPADMAAAILRQTGIALAAYLLAATTLALLASALGYRTAALVLVRAGLPKATRRLVTGTAGLSFAAGTVVLSNSSPAGAGPAIASVVAEQPSPPALAAMSLIPRGSSPDVVATATIVLLDSAPAVEPIASAAPTPTEAHEEWIVGSGDSFWAIAEDLLHEFQGSEHTDVDIDVATYCRQLIAANHDRLARSDQPDLLFPGQVLTVPPPVG